MQSGENNKVDISVIMTALNEEKNILAAIDNSLRAFKDCNINGELIVVNDGSTDRTGELVENVMNKGNHVRMISHRLPEGVGASFWDGVDIARGEIVNWFPGDNENDPWEIFRYYKLLEHVDIVIPFIFNREARSLFRNILSYAYRVIINTTFSTNFNYTNGTILYRKSLLKELGYRSSGFFFQTDILIRTVKKGYLFAEIPYRLGMRKEGISKAISYPSLLNVIRGYIKLVCNHYFNNKDKEVNVRFTPDSQTAVRRGDKPLDHSS